MLRSQSQAVYSPDNLGHFGLALARYAHFTSPIRRFPDLIVHRALISAYGLGEGGLPDADKGRFEEFGEHLSMCERRAVAAERGAMDRYVAAYMADHVGATFPGRVTGVTRFGLFVALDGTRRRRADPDPRRSARSSSATTKAARCWSASGPARPSGWATDCG